jgi:hypothetical protein
MNKYIIDDSDKFAEALKKALKEHVTISVDVHKAHAYFDSDTITIKVMFDGKVIIEHTAYP